MKKVDYTYPSATGVCEIAASCYMPEDRKWDTVLVIHHGMAEHQARYLGFIEYLTKNGTAVYMHDMANHGRSNRDFALTGWFGEQNGYKALVKDFRENVLRAKRENPGKKLIVMGHSMGSFICRLYTAWYPDDGISGAVYMGTGGPNPAAGAGKTAAKAIAAVKGKKHKSRTLDKLAFGTYNKTFEGRTAFDWLTRDNAIVDRYIEDQYCGFLFTVQGMHDLVEANVECNTDKWFNAVPKALPILLVSGAQDPVGSYSAGIKAVAAKLSETGHMNVTTKLYPDCRHEILNELNKDEVMADIVQWMNR
ncbi:MAG: alpha/beta fold hydrolase [Clostridia bacterium]|nr:alpha/beta fold hydrolase [Clostridia bacterium]